MECAACQFDNREGRRFCAECGAPLSAACAACGFSNEAGEKFCGGCGTRLATDRAPMPGQQREEADGERRQVTIMYTDLSGYTQLAESLDAEDLHLTMGRVLDGIDRVVVDHGGTVHRHVGDEVMALFGTPVAHSDDPLRAVMAAFESHAAMTALSAELGRELTVHIGIASGEVVVAGQGQENPKDVPDYAITGVAANLASRLNGLAGRGETIVSDAVYQAVGTHVDCDSLGAVEVKGLDKAVAAWRIVGRRTERHQDSRIRFVGRLAELGQLEGILGACEATQVGQAILLRGEAGIGKSRLVEEFEARAQRRGFASHKGLVLNFGVGRGQDPIGALVGGLLDLPPEMDTAARANAAARASQGYAPDQRVFINDLTNLPQPDELRGLYDAMDNVTRIEGKKALVDTLVRDAGNRQPRLLILEDIHWADPATLDYLARITVAVQHCPALLIMTSRIEGDPLGETWRSEVHGSALMTMDLRPLRKNEAMELAGTFSQANTEFTMHCIERAGGSPLFLEQLLRRTEQSANEDIPATIQSLVMARIDQLPRYDKWALQAASAIGQRFTLESLQALLSDAGYSCSGLLQHHLVRRVGSDFLFAHALIQEAVYGSLLKAKKSDLHRRAAAWFANRDPVLHAEHLDRADDPAAPIAYLDAARNRATAYQYDQALQLADRGLAIATERNHLYTLSGLRGEILHDTGAIPESIAAYERTLEFGADDEARCRARIGLAAGMRVVDRYDDALLQLEQAEVAASKHSLLRELAQIHHLRGNLYFPLGNIEGCRAQHELSLKYAREADFDEGEVYALSGLGDAEYACGRMISAGRHFKRCVELARKRGLGRIEVDNLNMIGFTRQYCLELNEAADYSRSTIEIASAVGNQRAELLGRMLAYNVLHEQGRIGDAIEHLDESTRLAGALGARRFEPQTLIYRAKLLRSQGLQKEALQLCDEAVAICRETGIGFLGPRVFAEYASNCGETTAAQDALAEGEAILKAGSVGHNHPHFYRDAMEVCLRQRDRDNVERYASELEHFTRPEPLPWSDFFVARGRALARCGRERFDGALQQPLERLARQARRAGLGVAIAAIDHALSTG